MKHRCIGHRYVFFANSIKFIITGGLGTLTNLLLFFLLVEWFHANPILASALCFFIAATQNYLVNHFWTFHEQMQHKAPSVRRWWLFILGSLASFGINLVVLQITLEWFKTVLYSQALGIGAGLILNFFVAKLIIFKSDTKV